MGKFPTSLLSIVFQLYLIDTIFADEQVRRVQEELRKRHLFYGNMTGETSPALITAITRYQDKKGIRHTGRLDSETCASLGVVNTSVAPPAITPSFVVTENDVRDANGESLPNFLAVNASSDAPNSKPESSASEPQRIAAPTSPVNDTAAPSKKQRLANSHSRAPPRPAPPHKETNPFVLAFHTVDHAMKLVVTDTQPKMKRVRPKRRV
jgi:peptidoglycan hydrolase-like protein with peptidoglycan-binding domain